MPAGRLMKNRSTARRLDEARGGLSEQITAFGQRLTMKVSEGQLLRCARHKRAISGSLAGLPAIVENGVYNERVVACEPRDLHIRLSRTYGILRQHAPKLFPRFGVDRRFKVAHAEARLPVENLDPEHISTVICFTRIHQCKIRLGLS